MRMVVLNSNTLDYEINNDTQIKVKKKDSRGKKTKLFIEEHEIINV